MATIGDPTLEKKEEQKEEDASENQAAAAEDEDTGAQVAPIVKLQEVAVATGEENEDVLLDRKAKLYRFDKEASQWKERGVGIVKLLKHKETGKVRLVMRQSKTLKICANHRVLPTMTLQEHLGNEKSCVWHASDFADGELKDETFCIRFPTVEDCKLFKEMVEEIAGFQETADGDDKEAVAAATLIEKLSVGSKGEEEEKPKAKEVPAVTEENKEGSEKEETEKEETEK